MLNPVLPLGRDVAENAARKVVMTAGMKTTLKAGSRVAVVAPGGALASTGIGPALAWLEECGWVPRLGLHLHDRHRYLAGSREDRLADLRWALTAPDIEAVWFARGGYGTVQLLDALPWEGIDDRLLLGFSDASAVMWARARRGLPSIHAPVLTTLCFDDRVVDAASQAALRRLLVSGEPSSLPGEHLIGPRSTVRGPIVGGNLTVLASLAGTSEAFVGEGAIVVLEDVYEAPYRLDRLLTQLIASGGLRGALGIALGEFAHCDPPIGATYSLADIWREYLGPLGIPVIYDLPVGHGQRNYAFPYGAEATLSPTGVTFA